VNSEPTLLSAAWRYRLLVLVVTATVAALGAIALLVRPDNTRYIATTSVVLQEPVSTEGVTSAEAAGGRFVASQVEIMASSVVAAEAAELLAEFDFEVSADEVLAASNIFSTPDSPLVSITAQHAVPELAIGIANSVADGYRQVSRRQATATAQSQLTQVDAQLAGVEGRLEEIDAELTSLREDAEGIQRLEEQANEALEVIPELQEELVDADGEEAEQIRSEIEDYRQRIEVYQEISTGLAGGPAQAALVQEQTLLANRRAELQSLIDNLTIDAELAPDAIALIQPADAAVRAGSPGTFRTLGIATVLGLALAIALAYFLTVSRRSFSTRMEPETVLGAPLLADVPAFDEEGLRTALPVRDTPRSAAAEAYRFAASSLAVACRNKGIRSLAFLSATQGQGKTTSLVNAAMAAAAYGSSVLVVDCDFGNQQALRLLMGSDRAVSAGITDVLEGTVALEDAIRRVELGDGFHIDVIGRGIRPTMAATSLQSAGSRDLFESMAQRYDLVFVDSPPLLQVAYASRIAELVEGVVAVVEHQSAFREAEDLVDRIALVGTPLVGYVYNRSALRREMTMSEGSMMDIIGDGGLSTVPVTDRRSKRRASSARRDT
jgi:Mrp family chromosome partitioning ATPase/capsular polysaccharide biosynthesis protein